MKLTKIMLLSLPVLIISAAIDLVLWFKTQFMVPCWVVSGMSVGAALLIFIIIRLCMVNEAYEEKIAMFRLLVYYNTASVTPTQDTTEGE
jgi:hypothetical protein